ncbi:synaptonemal complex protein 1-like [Chironomus tepperi]|uniref:synaptonemal complex protein 1-like n=1 Tax=Chironomus tepperi TaxID=113505 RepID=UPI00391F4AA0
MPAEEKISKDDPQIHLLAAKYCHKIQGVNLNSINDEEVKILKSCIQFFAHYIKLLPECVNDVLKMCRCFLAVTKDGSIEFDVVAINRIVGICTTMLIRRKEEDVIRSTCVVLRETLEIIPLSTLKVIVTKYAKTLSFIFQKLYVVQTYYTQLRVLEIFVFITKDLKKLLSDTISKHHLLRSAKEEAVKLVIDKINKIDFNDFENSSRKFLRFYNNILFPKTCILSVEGRMTKMNGHPVKQKESMLVNFNGRNLTVSFFVPNSLFLSQETAKIENDFLVFIEFECKSIESISKVYKGRHYTDVTIDVTQAATYNEDMTRESLDEIKKVSLRLIDEEATLKKFSDVFLEKYKQKERMIGDPASGIDKMSIMTFQTSASLLDDLKTMNEIEPQLKTQDLINEVEIPKHENLKTVQVKPRVENEAAFNDMLIKKETAAQKKAPVQSKSSQIKSRPKRQSAKKANERLSDIYDEDNMEDERKLPTYRDFKAQQKKKDTAIIKTVNHNSQDSNRNYYLEPVEVITRTTLKRKTIKTNKYESKPKRYDTDEENREVNRKGRTTRKEMKNHELKIQHPKTVQRKFIESEERKPLTNFDLIKNVTKDIIDVKSTNNKEQKPVQKRKFPLLDNDDINMEIEPPIKVVNQSNKKPKVNEASEESLISEPTPNSVFYKEKPAQKRPKEVNNQEIRVQKRRRLTKDNVFEFSELEKEPPKINEATSKVEEWLKSTSDSFSLDMSIDHIEREIPVKQNTVKSDVPKDTQNEDADNESEMSFGQFANDEHQHYSSSSHESMDLDVKNLQPKTVASVIEKKPKLVKKHELEYPSTSRQIGNASQNDYNLSQNNTNAFMDPCKTFNIRCTEAAVQLNLRKKKIDDSEKNIFKMYDHAITKLGKKCLEQVQKTKANLKHVKQLHVRYESAKSKLMDELTEQEKMFGTLKREIAKRTEAMELHNQNKKKELMNLKKEALRKNEEMMQDVWRDYIDNFQSCFNNSIQKAYEI